MTLEAQLVALLEAGDLQRLVRAMCACARRQLPRAQVIDPFNGAIVETAEAWASGACTLENVRDVAKRASDTRGGVFTSACVKVVAGPADEREGTVRMFARQLPTSLWMASAAGKAWGAKMGPLAQVGRDPNAREEIAALDAELATLAERS